MTQATLALDDVTLCAIDCASPALAARALTLSQLGCRFGDAILLSDTRHDGNFRHVAIDRLATRAAYSGFVIERLVEHVSTPFVLLVQWDGYVLEPAAFSPAFRDCDYIGATWPDRGDGLTVGNGGFSWRSARLLRALRDGGFQPDPRHAEDELIGRHWRGRLERDHAICFAPEALADRFSHEARIPETPTFGFHGFFNLALHASEAELIAMAPLIETGFLDTNEFCGGIAACLLAGRDQAAEALLRHWSAHASRALIETRLGAMFGSAGGVEAYRSRAG